MLWMASPLAVSLDISSSGRVMHWPVNLLPPHGHPSSSRSPPGPGQPLSRALLLANAPSTPLSALTRLDLSLERLSTLAGLDALCPTLTVGAGGVNAPGRGVIPETLHHVLCKGFHHSLHTYIM